MSSLTSSRSRAPAQPQRGATRYALFLIVIVLTVTAVDLVSQQLRKLVI